MSLYVVATPIGNLDDMTIRGLATLREVSSIVAEDTRSYRILVARHGLPPKPVYSLYKGNESARVEQLIPQLRDGLEAALVSESGTPAVSDPGALLVRRCHESGIKVVPVPGPSALPAILSVSGIFAPYVVFLGFLPKKNPVDFLMDAMTEETAVVFFENPGRFGRTLADLAARAPDARIVIGRELTKRFEECWAGQAKDAPAVFAGRTIKGEIVAVVEPAPEPSAGAADESAEVAGRWLEALRAEHLPLSAAVRVVSGMLNLPKRRVYDQALKLWEAA